MTSFPLDRMLAELHWHTKLVMLKYRVQLPPLYEPTGRTVNGIYREVRRVR